MQFNLDELKGLILWLKEQKVRSFKSGEIEFTFTDQAYSPSDFAAYLGALEKTPEQLKREEDELLFHSAG